MGGTVLLDLLFHGLNYGIFLFLLAVGFTLIFGMLDIINLAHGSFYMIGAYLGLLFVRITGNFWLAMFVVPILVGSLGLIIERYFLRFLYKRGVLAQVLLTFGFIYLFDETAKWIWGPQIKSIEVPFFLSGSLDIFEVVFPKYRVFMIFFGLFVALFLYLLVERTRLGSIIRAGVSDSEMTNCLGINIFRVFSLVFALGTALAGLSGVVAGPIISIYPGMGDDILIQILIVVIIGGLGSFKGSFVGSLFIGQIQSFGNYFLPEIGMIIIYLAMAATLLIRPKGIFGYEAE